MAGPLMVVVWLAGFATVVAIGHLAGWLGVLALVPVFWQLGKLVKIVDGTIEP